MKYETKVAVLGGGVTGLCAAHYLAERFGRESVLVLEADERVGGTARTDAVDGFLLDWGPNGFLDREPLTLRWASGIGLTDELVRADAAAKRRFILRDGRLVEILAPPKFFFSPILSISGRLRVTCEPFVPAKRDPGPETIWQFAARRIGGEAADVLVSSMVTGVFGGDARRLSIDHCFPRMVAMEREYGSLVRALLARRKENADATALGPGGTLTTFRRGAGQVAEAAANQLAGRVLTGAPARRVTRSERAYLTELEHGDLVESERLVVALPSHAAAPVLAPLDAELSGALEAIPYADIAVVCTAYPRSDVSHDLHGFGYLVPRVENRRTLGCLWTSSIFPHEAPSDCVLLRTMLGGALDPAAVRLTDSQLLDCVTREVHPLLGIAKPPELVRIYRHAPGIPQYTLAHAERLAVIERAEQRYPYLALAGNAYRGVGLNECVVSAVRAMEQVAAAPG